VVEGIVFPSLVQILGVDRSPAIIMGVVGVCDSISKKIGTEYTARKVENHYFLSNLKPDPASYHSVYC